MTDSQEGYLLGGRYRIGKVIGRGGMGTVWDAHDTQLDRPVAAREVRLSAEPGDEQRTELTRQAIEEARSAAGLTHPSIVPVYDVIDDGVRLWTVMQRVDGRSLERAVNADGPWAPVDAARVGLDVLNALEAAHAAGVVHRDVKPSNILIGPDGVAMLTDFSIAHTVGADGVTSSGAVPDPPVYIAPERIVQGPAAPAADLFSMGATLFFAVEGRSPFHATDSMAAAFATAIQPHPRPEHAGPLTAVIDGLLEKDPHNRLSLAAARHMIAGILGADVERSEAGGAGAGVGGSVGVGVDEGRDGDGVLGAVDGPESGESSLPEMVTLSETTLSETASAEAASTGAASTEAASSGVEPGEAGLPESELVEVELVESELVEVELVESELVEVELVEVERAGSEPVDSAQAEVEPVEVEPAEFGLVEFGLVDSAEAEVEPAEFVLPEAAADLDEIGSEAFVPAPGPRHRSGAVATAPGDGFGRRRGRLALIAGGAVVVIVLAVAAIAQAVTGNAGPPVAAASTSVASTPDRTPSTAPSSTLPANPPAPSTQPAAPRITSLLVYITKGSAPGCQVTTTATVNVSAGPATVTLMAKINGGNVRKTVTFGSGGAQSKWVYIGVATASSGGAVHITATAANTVQVNRAWSTVSACINGFTAGTPTVACKPGGGLTISIPVTLHNSSAPDDIKVRFFVNGGFGGHADALFDPQTTQTLTADGEGPYTTGPYQVYAESSDANQTKRSATVTGSC